MFSKHRTASWAVFALSFVLLLYPQTPAQSVVQNPPPATKKEKSESARPPLSEEQLPAFATSLVISLATEARSYSDLALRPRVLARAADVLWEVDNITARELFKRAWEAAEQGDAEEVTIKTKDKPPEMVLAMRRMRGHDLRYEVLSLVAQRDRVLSEGLFAKLKSENERNTQPSKTKQTSNDGWYTSEAATKRLAVASKLLEVNEVERAVEFATPALDQVNAKSINFLSTLRGKDAAAADRLFALLLARAAQDPSADANTVSGLSSYLFTPGTYVTFSADGGTTWTQPGESAVSPAQPPADLRNRFFEIAARILLRPLPPPAEDFSSSGRVGKLKVIRRLLPLFEQFAPDSASALRAQLIELTNGSTRNMPAGESFLVIESLQPPLSTTDAMEQMQTRLDRAKTSADRDEIYAAAAATLLAHGDERAPDVADKIENAERRIRIREYIDFEFVRRAIRNKAPAEAIRLAQTGKLSSTQRAWSYIEVARLLRDTERQRALELLEEAVREINRIAGDKPDRAVLLVGVVNELIASDRVRAWEVLAELVKEANRLEEFNGENTIAFPLMTRSAPSFIRIAGENFSISNVVRAVAQDDLYRAVELAKSFKFDAVRASVTLAIASSILENKRRQTALQD